MANLSPPNPALPVRSISLPSTSHPNSVKVEAQLTKLRSWDSSANPLKAETIQTSLTKLAELFNSIQDLVHSPLSQQAFHPHHSSQVEEAIEGSVGLLDVCGTVRDLFMAMKEHVQGMQSLLRRRGARDSSIESSILAYVSFRKKTKKEIAKSIRTLKRTETKVNGSYRRRSTVVEDQQPYVIEVINEARAIAISIFRSLVSFLSMPEVAEKNAGGWSMISKLTRVGMLASDKGQKTFNEVGNVDVALCSIQGQVRKKDAKVDVQEVQRRLEKLDECINGFNANLDCIFKSLIQIRVSLLNLVTP
ncbi:SELECTION/UPKEEP OF INTRAEPITHELIAL T-CELLS PROTEIN [Salix viminalis]|uniref:SELECTION/UPKEEP OF INTRAEPITHELIAL T-CELLS PROTEIN n=1 Tax=Salix viminalis TaxID=40686 RepID=A0A9Q0UVQ6_SALVM|nr:SELECTION/UPKEEP OF INTRAEPITHELIAL T-CELLS PROTEIN [Salix viminalis]